MLQKRSENNLLESAFQLAYFILGDVNAAELTATAAVSRLNVAVVAQDRRYYYVPGTGAKSLGARTKVSLGELHLLQRLVYDEVEPFEHAQEESATVSEERLLRHFLKHLVRITLKRNSFYVTLGVSRLLHRYSTPEAVEIYSLIVQNPSRVKDNHYWRSRKAQLMQELKMRFGDLITLTRSAYGEERFAVRDDSPRYAAFVKDCLKTLMPWGSPCPLPAGTDPISGFIPALDFKGADPDEEHQVEIARIHAALHSDCFARLVAGLNLDAPDARLEVPQFFYPRNRGGNDPMPNPGYQHTEMNPPDLPDLKAMRARVDEQDRLIQRARPRHLRLLVDHQERGMLDLRGDSQTRFTLAEGEEFIELRTPVEEGDLRLALYPIDYARLERATDADEFVLALPRGPRLNFTIAPLRDEDGEVTGATVIASHRASSRRQWLGLGAIFNPPATVWPYALTAALILTGLVVGVIAWRMLRADTELPKVAVNAPPAAASPQLTASGTPRPPQPEPSRHGSGAGQSSHSQPGERGAAPSGLRRDPDVDAAPAIKLVAEMKQIFISLDGDSVASPVAQALREQLSRQLQAGGRWTVASQEEADVAMNVKPRSDGHTAAFQLVNANGRIIWPSKGKWRTYSGDAEQIAKQVVNELLKAAR